jgi:hypothetical protein
MAAAERVAVVEMKVEAPVRAAGEPVHGKEFALELVDHREVPVEHVDVHAAPLGELIEESADLVAGVVRGGIRPQADAAVEVPARDDDRVPRPLGGGREGGEVCLSVDQKGELAGPLDAPAVATGAKDLGLGGARPTDRRTPRGASPAPREIEQLRGDRSCRRACP